MSDSRARIGVFDQNPALEHLQVPTSDLCWWCGDLATTEEHRIKATTLRRVARSDDGTVVPSNVHKKSSDFDGQLQSLNKGIQIRWPKNLCANCNNAKSQPFDHAYDHFEAFLVEHFEEMCDWEQLEWRAVYGAAWNAPARNLARYFGKQLGCMLASYQLPVPNELIDFLDGAERCPSVAFMLFVNPRAVGAHRVMRKERPEDGLSTFVGLVEAQAYQTGNVFTGIDYIFHIGYLWFTARWRAGTDSNSWFEYPEISLPKLLEDGDD